MGFLPITLALVALLIIVSLVNLAGIRRHSQALNFALFNVCQTVQSRHTILKRNKTLPGNMLCPDFSHSGKLSEAEILSLMDVLSIEKQSIKESDYALKHGELSPRLQRSLLVLNQRQSINIRILERKIREYNTLIGEYPTKMVAWAWKYRIIDLPTEV